MKTMDELVPLLKQPAPYGQHSLIEALNDVFGPFGWDFEIVNGNARLKVMTKVSDGHFLSITRDAENIERAALTFGPRFDLRKDFNEPPQAPTPEAESEPSVSAPLQPRPSRKVVEDSISECSQIILQLKRKTQDELVKMLQKYGVKTKSQLSDEQAMELLNQLKEIVK